MAGRTDTPKGAFTYTDGEDAGDLVTTLQGLGFSIVSEAANTSNTEVSDDVGKAHEIIVDGVTYTGTTSFELPIGVVISVRAIGPFFPPHFPPHFPPFFPPHFPPWFPPHFPPHFPPFFPPGFK